MGTKDVESAVTDAGPLIHLAEIGGLSLLSIFDALHVPDGVWSETVEQGRVSRNGILELVTIRRHTLPQSQVAQFIQQNGLEHLQKGERECLCLCRQIDVTVLLTDDLAVRHAAECLKVTPVGSLGVVARAHHQGHITLAEAERQIADLYDVSSLFVTRAIVELAMEQLHKQSGRGNLA